MNENIVRALPPHASKIIESLRGLGYSPETAIADLIDNCIAAGSTQIDIKFVWKGPDSFIWIADNGCGMNEDQLFDAMKLGYIDSRVKRNKSDLGRFGLGMKTASFSQCRCLTVMSRIEKNKTAVYSWDLDFLEEYSNGEWLMMKEAGPCASTLLPMINERPHGTIVVWEKLDRIVSSGLEHDDFLNMIDRIEQHLCMTFQRFIEGTNPRIIIRINSKNGSDIGRIQPFDPFYRNSSMTWCTPKTRMKSSSGDIIVRGYVLPHKDRLSASEYKNLGGPKGWNSQQGFYIYRNDRLILAGSWMRLGKGHGWTKDEAYRLARISIDIPNTADEDWHLNIVKSTAMPPAELVKKLTKFAETVRAEARKVYYNRHGLQSKQTFLKNNETLWIQQNTIDGVEFRISRDHPAVNELLELGEPMLGKVKKLLALLEKNVPMVMIPVGRQIETQETSSVNFEAIRKLYLYYIEREGMSPSESKEQLKKNSEFFMYFNIIDNLPDSL